MGRHATPAAEPPGPHRPDDGGDPRDRARGARRGPSRLLPRAILAATAFATTTLAAAWSGHPWSVAAGAGAVVAVVVLVAAWLAGTLPTPPSDGDGGAAAPTTPSDPGAAGAGQDDRHAVQ